MEIKEEPTYYYKWKRLEASTDSKSVTISAPLTDELSTARKYAEFGWTRLESSKMTFDEIV